jgi:hypothetical protein
MAGLDIAAVMDSLAAGLVAGGACTVAHAWPNEAARVGEGIVGYPEAVEFDLAFGRGLEEATFPVLIVCGGSSFKTTRTTAAALITGATDVKDALEAYAGSWDSLRVVRAVIEEWEPIGQPAQLVVRWDCHVIGG